MKYMEYLLTLKNVVKVCKTYNNILKKNFKDIIKCIENKINNSILNNEEPELNLVYNLKNFSSHQLCFLLRLLLLVLKCKK